MTKGEFTVNTESGKQKIVVEGNLICAESEGGFGPDCIEVDGQYLSDVIARLFGVALDGRGSLGDHVNFGRVRLTIERLENLP